MRYALIVAAALAGAAFWPVTAHAGNGLLSLGVGENAVFDSGDHAVDFRIEYRDGDPLFWKIKPFAGIEGTAHGTLYGVGGLLLDMPVAPHWYVTPGIGAGLYHAGSGPDLGSALEFRSQVEAGYEFESRDRLSLGLSHTSNFGIDAHDPGTEALTLYYHMPVSRFTGNGQ